MELVAVQRAEQKQILSPVMRQSLQLLQMTLPELRDYLQEQLLSNPLLELETPEQSDPAPELPAEEAQPAEGSDLLEAFDDQLSPAEAQAAAQIHTESALPDYPQGGGEYDIASYSTGVQETFTAQLLEQLTRMRWLSAPQQKLAAYLIECLDEAGYLRFDLHELAEELHTDPAQVEQALFVVQALEPAGTGARNLSECLLLQLAQSSDFNALTVGIAQNGLPLLAKNNIAGLAKLLGCTKAQAQQAADAVRRLNPIPSRGYSNGRRTVYQVPEAVILRQNGELTIRLNRTFAPQPVLSTQTERLLSGRSDAESADYLRRQLTDAKQLIDGVASRTGTISRILTELIGCQSDFFTSGGPLRPLTMSHLAGLLGLSTSTVSRAVQGKSILFEGKNLELRSFFTGSLETADGQVSTSSVKHQLLHLVQTEDTAHPFSDEQLRGALEATGSVLSRRTVAKYREALGIPAASQRRR